MRKRRWIALACLGLFLFALTLTQTVGFDRLSRGWQRWTVMAGSWFDVVIVEGEAALLLDPDTGAVLFSKNENKRMYPASTTKVLTALVAIENGSLNEIVVVGEEVLETQHDESQAGLRVGEQWQLGDLIQAMILPSGNDAARTIAVHIARKVYQDPNLSTDEAFELFASLMNQRAAEAGATGSHFVNPHGLHDERHYTTAHDLAKIAQEAMRNSWFREVVRMKEFPGPSAESEGTASVTSGVLQNRNLLLRAESRFYLPGANGVKTGYTSAAGSCLVASAERDGQHLIAIVLNSSSTGVWQDAIRLMEYGFAL